LIVFVIVAFLGISCSKSDSSTKESQKAAPKVEAKAETKPVKPAPSPEAKPAPPEKFHHGGMTKMGDFTVQVPEDVKNTWKKVALSIHTIKTKKQMSVVLPIGRKTEIKGTPFEIEVLYFLPNFTMGGSLITSKDNEQKNPAAKVKVYEKGTMIWSGWLFQKFPKVHPFTHVDYRIFLVKGLKD
jgi:hypothetical protein